MDPMHRFYRFAWRQPWLDFKYKKSIYKKLCGYGEVPDAPFAMDFFGLRYQGNLNNSIEFNIFYYGAFEKPLLFFLRDTLNSLSTDKQDQQMFVDVGANIGQHTLFMSRYAREVHAFEPYSVVREKLEKHIQDNGIENVEVHPLGLSNASEQLDFFAPTGRNQGIGSFDAASVSKGNARIGKLELVRGDDYLQQRQFQRISLIKIDVEGFEKNVLQGLQETLSKDRPVVVCEITYGNALSFTTITELQEMLPVDYQLFTFNTRKQDGTKARRRGAKAKRSGKFELIDFDYWLDSGQDDVVACPVEKLGMLPRTNIS